MVITVIGAGTMGSAVVSALAQNSEVSQIHVCDARPGALQGLHEQIQAHKVRAHELDARNLSQLKPLMHTSRVVVNCIASEMSPVLAQLAIEEGVHFCDLGGYRDAIEKVLELNETAKKAGVWVVPNCGLAPGLVNILCMQGVQQFDTVHGAYLRAGTIPLQQNPPLNFASFFSAEKLLEEYTEQALSLHAGEVVQQTPLTGVEPIHFSAPLGTLESFYVSGVLAQMAPKLVGRIQNMDFKAIRYPNHASQMSFLLALGFAEKRMIDVGTHLTYRDVLTRRIRKRMGGDVKDAVLLRVVINGIKEGKERSLVYQLREEHDENRGGSAVKRCIGASVAAVATFLGRGAVQGAGVLTPEFVLPPDLYLEDLASYGVVPEVTWFEGFQDVNQAFS
ncbi:MAG: saccharopine dehydrogenase NADP-binding domain-containing protein [Bacteroidetes Order II. Incertae sedis bacterium]|nr:saccharopine dehydrogenase NADP-binding domain-containing protein [Bacteroidetes Order II. bacterium]